MLAILIVWFYIFLICLVFGCAAARFLAISLKEDGPERLPLSLLILLGLSLVTACAGYLSLFIKIAFLAQAIIFLGAFLLAALCRRELRSSLRYGARRLWAMDRYILALLILSSFFILLKSAAPPSAYDSGLYHAQAIRWIEEYPVVPGLGNLHSRLAFNSAWFPANALFGFSFWQVGPLHVLNGFLLWVVAVMSLEGLSNLIKGQYRLNNVLRAAVALPVIFIFKDHLSSPAPDIPAALLTCAIFIFYIRLRESPEEVPRGIFSMAVILLATFAITIKLSALPLALLAAALAGQEISRGRLRNIWLTCGAVLVLVLPYFLRNYWLSGYLIYPLSGLDQFHPDWKMPEATALGEQRAIVAFARDPGYLAPPAAVKTSFGWVPYWLPQVAARDGKKLELIFIPSLILLLDWLRQTIRMRACKIELREIGKNWSIYLTVACALFFWFLNAPDPRFVVGFLLAAATIFIIPFLKSYDYRVSPWVPWSLALMIFYFLAAFAPIDFPVFGARLWRPAPYPQTALVVKEIQGHKVYFPRNGGEMGWYAPLPCAYYYPGKFGFRGERLEDGFKP